MEQAAENILVPVLESAVMLAARYAKACGRSTVTGQDMALGLMFSARHVTGKQLGSFFSDDEEDDDDDVEEVDEDDEPFTRYTGDSDDLCLRMNECADTWHEWIPENPAEEAFKHAVDKAKDVVA